MPESEPIINFRAYQKRAFWMKQRILGLIWSRRRGKSYTLACKALERMMDWVHDVYFVSASLRTGQENIRKMVEIWLDVMAAYRVLCEQSGNHKLESNVDGLDIDAVCEIFDSSKLEVKIHHSNTRYSRALLLAPNPDTAVGFGGDVFLDEVGRIPEFKGVHEAVEPIMQDNAEFIFWMSTTPPPDDSHPSFEMLSPVVDKFEPNPEGNLYTSNSGTLVHRADAYDAEAAGIPFLSLKTGKPISIEQAREEHFDKQAFDRNYLCKFIAGGVAALQLHTINQAMQLGEELGSAEAYITESLTAA